MFQNMRGGMTVMPTGSQGDIGYTLNVLQQVFGQPQAICAEWAMQFCTLLLARLVAFCCHKRPRA